MEKVPSALASAWSSSWSFTRKVVRQVSKVRRYLPSSRWFFFRARELAYGVSSLVMFRRNYLKWMLTTIAVFTVKSKLMTNLSWAGITLGALFL